MFISLILCTLSAGRYCIQIVQRMQCRLFLYTIACLGYEIIAQQLTDEVEVKDAEQFTELISKFYDRLSEVNGEDLLPLLLEKGTIR